eukprot:366458-Chlamydomonas_euryale.AAC.37
MPAHARQRPDLPSSWPPLSPPYHYHLRIHLQSCGQCTPARCSSRAPPPSRPECCARWPPRSEARAWATRLPSSPAVPESVRLSVRPSASRVRRGWRGGLARVPGSSWGEGQAVHSAGCGCREGHSQVCAFLRLDRRSGDGGEGSGPWRLRNPVSVRIGKCSDCGVGLSCPTGAGLSEVVTSALLQVGFVRLREGLAMAVARRGARVLGGERERGLGGRSRRAPRARVLSSYVAGRGSMQEGWSHTAAAAAAEAVAPLIGHVGSGVPSTTGDARYAALPAVAGLAVGVCGGTRSACQRNVGNAAVLSNQLVLNGYLAGYPLVPADRLFKEPDDVALLAVVPKHLSGSKGAHDRLFKEPDYVALLAVVPKHPSGSRCS